MEAALALPDFGYRYIPGPFQYSAGVAALDGHRIERLRFASPVPLEEGFARIERYLGEARLKLTAFCACELRSPAPFTDDGFRAFNRLYVGTLERWGIMKGEANPVARSNVCPAIDPPSSPSFHAFSIAVPCSQKVKSFVIAGSGEAQEGAGPYSAKTIRYRDTSAGAMREKAVFVLQQMEKRMAALAASWADTSAAQVYTVHDLHGFLAEEIVARGAAHHGLTWHFARPPIIDLEYEMDCRGVPLDRVLPA
ncbi:hypothetical protein SAMN05519104_3023 [Rhizobiales bacterium GAS188]|nr:hypothetical protein SAMN05519104_3023 [Rhizobiales bacterium GAS188]